MSYSYIQIRLKSPNILRWSEIKRVGFGGSSFILFPHFDGFVCFATNKP